MFGFFLFQAEDGIRYLVRSRGLGDVYKRQVHIRNRRLDRRQRLIFWLKGKFCSCPIYGASLKLSLIHI